MVKVQVEACDVCADPTREVKHCEMAIEGVVAQAVLCEQHRAPLEELMKAVRPAKAPPVAKKRTPAKKASGGRRRAPKPGDTVQVGGIAMPIFNGED